MPQPTIPVLAYNFQSELGSTFGTHLDANFQTLVESLTEAIERASLVQRDDGWVRNQTIHANSFTSDALALMAGSSVSSDVEWLPRGDWVTATLYNVGNIVETGSPATAYVCAEQHTSGTFATDYAAGKWVVLSSPRTLASADVTTALTYTPVNKAGDTMTGALVMTTGSKIGGSSGMAFSDSLLATQDLLTVDKGLYSVYTSSKNAIIYGFASNVVRSSGSQFAVGGQFSAFGESGATEAMFGGNANAIGLSGFASTLIGWEVDIGSFDPNNVAVKRGVTIVFKNRGDGQTSPGAYSYTFPQGTYSNGGSGLGLNSYNAKSVGLHIDSQQRTATGEYCGWSKGIEFDEYSIDYNVQSSVTIPGIGIDFSPIHYYGGSDPTTAYHMDAAIAMRDLQAIWWNRDPSSPVAVNKVRTYFDVFTTRWTIALDSIERFGVDVNTGDIYRNGVIANPASLSGNNTWTGTNTFNLGISMLGHLTFTGLGRLIQGDFSNATLTSRVLTQTSTLNGATEFGLIPNGTATSGGFYASASSGLATGSVLARLGVDTTGVELSSTLIGGGAALPLDLAVGASARVRLNNAGQFMVGTTTAPAAAVRMRVNGILQIDQPVAFMVNKGGVNQNCASSTTTQLTFSTEEFDTNSNFDTGTGRFTPPAGKYLLSATAQAIGSVDQGRFIVMIYKNGAQHKNGAYVPMSGTGGIGSTVSCVVDANGTDYFDVRVYQENGTATTIAASGAATDCWFSGTRIA